MTGWVTVKQAATLTATSTRTVWRLIDLHNLDTSKDPGNPATLVHLDDIRRALTSSPKGNPRHTRRAS